MAQKKYYKRKREMLEYRTVKLSESARINIGIQITKNLGM
jgi:hypothetical protein